MKAGTGKTRAGAAGTGGPGRVAQRVVFYIPGFDPFPPRRYRELYRREGAEQARLAGYELVLQPGARGDSWEVAARIEGAEVATRFVVLVWRDLVQQAMPAGIAATYWQLLRTAAVYIGSGALGPILRLRIGPVLAAFYPVAVLLGQLLAALLAGAAVWWLGAWVVPGLLALIPAAVVAWLVLRAFKQVDGRFYAHYLMHDFAYAALEGGAFPADLQQRLAEFRARVRAAMAEGHDEVLVVGHSSGAHLAVALVAGLVREGAAKDGPVLSLLTLGQAIPMMSFLPRARELRADLRLMAAQAQVPWVDVSAPGDGCTFALCDPAAVSGVAPADQRWPLILSAAFSQTLSTAKQAELKRRYFRLHFQYLCAFDALPDRSDVYDYFRITAGPLTLWQRLGGRHPSASRITRPVSRYRSLVHDPAQAAGPS